jgi:hypothetical protein
MINRTLHPAAARSKVIDAEWMAVTAEKVLAAVEARRSGWQSWHVRAEAQRRVRAGGTRCGPLLRSRSELGWPASPCTR